LINYTLYRVGDFELYVRIKSQPAVVYPLLFTVYSNQVSGVDSLILTTAFSGLIVGETFKAQVESRDHFGNVVTQSNLVYQ